MLSPVSIQAASEWESGDPQSHEPIASVEEWTTLKIQARGFIILFLTIKSSEWQVYHMFARRALECQA